MIGDSEQAKKKAENPLQTVYNWQFVHSIHLWVQLLGEGSNEVLEPLIFPVVQLIDGTIRLNYNSKYFPLRFHLCHQLAELADKTGKFVPILPYFLDILSTFNFGKKGAKLSMKPMDFTCVLKLSKSQMTESGFKDATIEAVHKGLLETLALSAHKICFPELAIPALAQLRAFLKKSKVANYTKKIKTVKERIEENVKFMLEKRSHVTFGVRDLDQISTFEMHVKAEGTPLAKYYETFKGIKAEEKAKKAKKEMDEGYKFIPEYKAKSKDNKEKEQEEFKGIFGDENSEDDEEADKKLFAVKEGSRKRKKDKKGKAKNEPKAKKVKEVAKEESEDDQEDNDDEGDMVEDFDDFSDDE